MKRNIPFLVAILVLAGFFFVRGRVSPAETPPLFQSGLTLGPAMTRSKESGSLVLAMATADWCGPCQVLKKGALRDPRVEGWVKDHALAVYVDIDKSPGDAAVLRAIQVPTLVLFRGDSELGRVSGVVDADDLLSWFKSASNSTGEPAVSPPS
ncbi:MAG: Thiol:disulfide interchange protein DsbD [Phycisphaerales bacterium]|nr:Thiol:disulfide interchange protein DsbD [Phycisphaerales bacterium]